MANNVEPGRLEAVRRAAEGWRERLMSDQNRSQLARFQPFRRSTLDLTPGQGRAINIRALSGLLAGSKIRLSELYEDEEQLGDAKKRATAISRSATQLREDKGIDTLYLALGLATWHMDTGTPYRAPVALIPLQITPQGQARQDFDLQASVDDATINLLLEQRFRTDFQLAAHTSEERLAKALSAERPLLGLLSLQSTLLKEWSAIPELEIERKAVVGIFKYANLPMVTDLSEDNLARIAQSDFVAAMAGSEDARRVLQEAIAEPRSNKPDFDPPQSEFLILDADSSQNMAINHVLAGGSLVIWGPPGTGKSQTIANLIASLIAHGKRVLFVAQKRAAIDVVHQRLESVGLGDLVMDVHGGFSSKREFWQEMGRSLSTFRKTPEGNQAALHERLGTLRATLIGHDEMLHGTRSWGLSLYEMQVRLSEIPRQAQTEERLDWDSPQLRTVDDIQNIREQITEYADLGGMTLAIDYPEWAAAPIGTTEEAERAWNAADVLVRMLPETRTLLQSNRVRPPNSYGEVFELLGFLERIGQFMTKYAPSIYDIDHDVLTDDLAMARRFPAKHFAGFSSRYREAKRLVQSMSTGGDSVNGIAALHAVETSKEHVEKWRGIAGDVSLPRAAPNLAVIRVAIEKVRGKLAEFGRGLGIDLTQRTVDEIHDLARKLSATQSIASSLPRLRQLERYFTEQELEHFLEKIKPEIPPTRTADAVEWAWLQALLRHLQFRDGELANFSESALSQTRDQFMFRDKEHLEGTPTRVRRAVAIAATEWMDTYPDVTQKIRRESGKQRRHIAPRTAFRGTASEVLTALRPAWMISPLMVAEMLPATQDLFDVVIFDEASQIPPEEAIGSLARGKQVVIAGDSKQLPPTDFFRHDQTADDDDQADTDDDVDSLQQTDTGAFESILDVFNNDLPLRNRMLEWHYRSRDSRLIAFSNTYLYDRALTTFPGNREEGPFTHHLIPHRLLTETGLRSHPDEVSKVIGLVLEHARTHPDQSLGVIAFGQYHADKIQEALDNSRSALRDDMAEAFFESTASEPFFVKNIERVQGDERDVIILSIGYHERRADGHLAYRFGPINQDGGERRLNVAISRARSHLHLVSTFSHADMEPGRSSARGVELLRQYLEYVASGGKDLGTAQANHPLNAFELDVKEGLEERGIPFTPQYGVSAYRIDFALAHPERPGQFVLAVEADGDSYHLLPTVRDRDRLRQRVLEDKGWRFYRLSSTAWFRDRKAELDKIEEAWKHAVHAADNEQPLEPVAQPTDVPSELADAVPPSPPRRSRPRPFIPKRTSIEDYDDQELRNLLLWIKSDTLLRTEEELKQEMTRELGFKRRGNRIDARFSRVIEDVRGHRSL